MKKTIFLFPLILLLFLTFAGQGQSEIKSYYSGDAVNWNNNLYISSADTGYLEILKLDNDRLEQIVKIRPFDPVFNRYDEFSDAKLWPEGARLYVYAVSGPSLYKYELVNGRQLTLLSKSKNTYWEWYHRIDKFGDRLATVSDKGIKLWNTDIMDVVESIPFNNLQSPYNLRANNNRYISNLADNYLKIFDRESGLETVSIAVNYKDNPGNRQAYQDSNYNLYVVDDYYTKKFNLNGELLSSFRHLDYSGYDVASSGHTDYLFFSNGLGVVKLKKDNLELISSRTTTTLGGARGWAMGLKVVYLGGDKLVLFNNANILVMDGNFNLLASHEATEGAGPVARENLYLNLNHNFGAPQASINLSGGGYFPQENLIIDFAGVKSSIIADSQGRFNQIITVPNLDPKRVDIKVSGEASGLHYSIAFEIL